MGTGPQVEVSAGQWSKTHHQRSAEMVQGSQCQSR